jgi:hypothetical protein
MAPGYRPVDTTNFSPPDGVGKGDVGFVSLGNHHKPGRIPVQTVDDPWPQFPPDTGEVSDVMEEGVHQGPIGVANSRVDHQSRRLVDDNEVLVLEDQLNWNVLGPNVKRFRERYIGGDQLPGRHDVRLLALLPVDPHETLLYQGGTPRT